MVICDPGTVYGLFLDHVMSEGRMSDDSFVTGDVRMLDCVTLEIRMRDHVTLGRICDLVIHHSGQAGQGGGQ